ncbi:MAG: hypothetical protein WCD37_06630 [Chloroflexia bacterium]
MFRKRIERLGKTDEDCLLDLEIRRAMQAEYGSAEPPAGIFDRVMYAIRQRRRDEARAHGHMPAFKVPVLKLYAQIRKVITPVAINRLAPAGVAIALLLVFADANVQHMLGRHTSPPSIYTAPDAVLESRANVAVEADPRILPFPPARVPSADSPAKASGQPIDHNKADTDKSQITDNQDTNSKNEFDLNYGHPY